MAPIATRRHERIQQPFIRIPLRNELGQVGLIDLWREDHFDPDPDGDTVYVVLDLLAEERLLPVTADRVLRYEPTGQVVIELQAIDRHTGEGLAMPHTRIVKPDIPTPPKIVEQLGRIVAYEFSTRPLVGLTHIPDSPRRA